MHLSAKSSVVQKYWSHQQEQRSGSEISLISQQCHLEDLEDIENIQNIQKAGTSVYPASCHLRSLEGNSEQQGETLPYPFEIPYVGKQKLHMCKEKENNGNQTAASHHPSLQLQNLVAGQGGWEDSSTGASRKRHLEASRKTKGNYLLSPGYPCPHHYPSLRSEGCQKDETVSVLILIDTRENC